MLGANVLIWGDNDGVLCHPYYVNHETLKVDEREEALRWHRFALRCRDLFRAATDTSWYELAMERLGQSVVGGRDTARARRQLAVRQSFRDEHLIAVSLIDLSGSDDGSWLSATKRGTCTSADVEVLLDSPESWLDEIAFWRATGDALRPQTMSQQACARVLAFECRCRSTKDGRCCG